MVKQYTLTSISDFSALTIWPCRLQIQEESYSLLTMMVREKDGIKTSMLQTIMKRLKYYGYIGMNKGKRVCHFLQGIRCSELEAAVNVVLVQPEKYGTDFCKSVSYVGQMVMKKGSTMQSINIAKTRSQLVMPKVAVFRGK